MGRALVVDPGNTWQTSRIRHEHPDRSSEQALRRYRGLRRHFSGHPVRLAGGAAGAVRLGQDLAAAHHRRAGAARQWPRALSWRRCHPCRPAGAGRGLRVPALRAVQPHDHLRERGFRAAGHAAQPPAGRGRHPPAGAHAAGTGAARLAGRPLPAAALRGPAPAHRAGPGPGRGAEGAAAGRALRGARCPGAQGAAPLAATPA